MESKIENKMESKIENKLLKTISIEINKLKSLEYEYKNAQKKYDISLQNKLYNVRKAEINYKYYKSKYKSHSCICMSSTQKQHLIKLKIKYDHTRKARITDIYIRDIKYKLYNQERYILNILKTTF